MPEWAKNVADADRTATTAYGQSVRLHINADTVKVREIEFNAVAKPPKGSCKTVPST
ncbi:MAG: hypothetical protein LQ342_003891, partial [Letrouitia transgressa]